MTTFAIEQRPTPQYTFEAPRWADVLAKSWLILAAILLWIRIAQPKAEVYLLTRYDLVRRYIGPIPPVHWRVGYAFANLVIVVLWQEILISLAVKVWGGVCLG